MANHPDGSSKKNTILNLIYAKELHYYILFKPFVRENVHNMF